MSSSRCPLHCDVNHKYTRRAFLRGSTVLLAGSPLLGACASLGGQSMAVKPIRPRGPASNYVPTIRAAFVRRKEDYGMWWPGAVYDGQAARKMYTEQLIATARNLPAKLELRTRPIYTMPEAQSWVAQDEVPLRLPRKSDNKEARLCENCQGLLSRQLAAR